MLSKYVQEDKPPMTAEAKAWMEKETATQEDRYKAIVDEQDALIPDREKWYAEFLEIVQTKGFNFTGDQRRVIPKEEIAEKPDRADAMRVVW